MRAEESPPPEGSSSPVRLGAAYALTALAVMSAVAAGVLLSLNSGNRVVGRSSGAEEVLSQRGFIVAQLIAAVLFTGAGLVLTSKRPDLPLGFAALLTGLAGAVGVATGQWTVLARVGGHDLPLVDWALWFNSAPFALEPMAILTLYLFYPHGRRPQGLVGWLGGLAIGLCAVGYTGALFSRISVDPRGPFAGLTNPIGIPGMPDLGAGYGFGLLLGNAVVIGRWLRSRDDDRRAFRLLAVVALTGFALPVLGIPTAAARVLFEAHTILLLLVLLTAVLRDRVYGIDLVLNRALVYLLLSIGIAGVYGLLVGATVLAAGHTQMWTGPVAAVVAALCLLPVRERVQRLVNRFLYGYRDEPFAVLSRLAAHVESSADPHRLLEGLLQSIVDSLRVPAARLELQPVDGTPTSVGVGTADPEAMDRFPLIHQGEALGNLAVSRRSGQRRPDAAEAELLAQLAGQAAAAAHAVMLLGQLTRSRERVIGVAEDERRRLGRELHDGLGPLLTAASSRIDASRSLLDREVPDLPTVMQLLGDTRTDLTDSLEDLRRIVHLLRPPLLDQLGLLEAVRHLGRRATVPVSLALPDRLPALPAAVELTAYRLLAEAITNVMRHAGASRCDVGIRVTDRLILDVRDDGAEEAAWHVGVGLTSMRERVSELGGAFSAGPSPGGGGCIHAELPLTLFGVRA